MSFDEFIDRRGTNCSKWDEMERLYGVSPQDGLAMWVADTDYRPPAVVQQAAEAMTEHGIYGYLGDKTPYKEAVCWWMQNRHDWSITPEMVQPTHGLVNATGLCIDAFTAPGDGVVLFTPVYHAFARVIKAAGREVVECPLTNRAGRYEMDFDTYDAQMTGNERMVILCSPHNPGGRVWSRAELQGVVDFAQRHNLMIVSDEIHQDLIYPGQRHIPTALVDDSAADRLVTLTAASKTFNIAGAHLGSIIIEDPKLGTKMSQRLAALGISGNSFGLNMSRAAYCPEGAAWVDAQMAYLDGNREVFDAGVNGIPGIHSMHLEGTYLAWVDFSGTGMAPEDFIRRVQTGARIAASHGDTFGQGGESFLRFNLGMRRAHIQEAVDRLQAAFGDLQ